MSYLNGPELSLINTTEWLGPLAAGCPAAFRQVINCAKVHKCRGAAFQPKYQFQRKLLSQPTTVNIIQLFIEMAHK